MNTRLVSMTFAALFLLWSAVSFAGELEDGLAAYDRRDYKTALAMFTKAAIKGDASAQTMFGGMYFGGRGVAQDYDQAVSWFRKAADQGHAIAQFNLGAMYAEGRGVAQDYNQAVSWYQKTADQGEAPAQLNLGVMYAEGQGVQQDYVEAHKWFNIAAAYSTDKADRDRATKNRDLVANKMSAAQIAEAQKRAREWKKR
jgi:uncharacterized protein